MLLSQVTGRTDSTDRNLKLVTDKFSSAHERSFLWDLIFLSLHSFVKNPRFISRCWERKRRRDSTETPAPGTVLMRQVGGGRCDPEVCLFRSGIQIPTRSPVTRRRRRSGLGLNTARSTTKFASILRRHLVSWIRIYSIQCNTITIIVCCNVSFFSGHVVFSWFPFLSYDSFIYLFFIWKIKILNLAMMTLISALG